MIDDKKQLDRSAQHSITTFDLDSLEIVTALGRGAKGLVFLARDNVNDEIFALKVISKDSIEKMNAKAVNNSNRNEGNEYRRVSFEQEVLGIVDHQLLPRLRGVLATDKVIGYAIDYCPGGDLHSLRKKQTENMFSDDLIRFYAAELVLALEYLHNLGIVYRDLKPENIMIQENGHIMLVDFDLSTKLSPKSPDKSMSFKSVHQSPTDSVKKNRLFPFVRWCNSGISPEDADSQASFKPDCTELDSAEKSNSFVGTEEYVAPEIVSGKGHDFAVDWWSLGIVLHEMLYGTTPFKGSNEKETFHQILTKPPELVGERTSLRYLIRKLLEKDPKQRITVEGIKEHDYFKGIDWDLILRIQRPPYIPAHSVEEITVAVKDGIKGLDVELFVQELFANGDDGDGGEKNNKSKHGENDPGDLNKNKCKFHRPEHNQFSVF
ncbi:Serine/threonine-protein kinase OXI1 [Hibiscus syriacus]|uniref:non-specific serine/threonine protein kinase n=1 Tax=Hibiscus syriacus TaxID=106335 RepID=A0A6A3CGR5_HIBSY|nr:serine/threonine-protein kinase OXI1-like [Hibiscus syriacus]KAE8726518.1 Serine/threonine-protein kinase OXI1 [Hibiscus syriacus]